jgi:glycine/D-amino acid oxidase-like deaminating enzyme
MGTATTYFLTTETDLDVTLVEKGKIASGSTGDSSAILRHHCGPRRIYSEMAWWSPQFYREFEEHTGEPIAYDRSPLVRFGQSDTSVGEYAQTGYEVLSDLDIPVTRRERGSLGGAYPMLDVEGMDFAVGDDAAGYSDGTDVAGGFARAAQKADATVLTGVAVEDIRTENGSIVGVTTEDGSIATENVALTAGPWTPRLAERIGLDVPIERTRQQILVLDPPREFGDSYPDLVPTSAPPGGDWYMRRDFGEGVLIATHHTDDTVDPERYDRTPDEAVVLDLLDELEGFVPELVNARVRGQYCGVYSTTPDHDFVIDQAGPKGCYLGCGFSGHGFKHGPAVGRMLADLVVRGETDLADIEFFSLDRFEGNPVGHGQPEDRI